MAVTKINYQGTSYVGLSSDTKPTTDVRAGADFTERDTGLKFIWDGTAWGEIGQVGQASDVIQVTPALDTVAYAAGDVLFDTTAISNAVRSSGGRAELVSLTVLDEDDQAAAALDLYFLRSNASLGTFNAAPAITDANAREIQGHVAIASGDWKDVGGAKVACIKNIGLMLEPTTGRDLYVAGVTAGTPTQTVNGIKIWLGFRW